MDVPRLIDSNSLKRALHALSFEERHKSLFGRLKLKVLGFLARFTDAQYRLSFGENKTTVFDMIKYRVLAYLVNYHRETIDLSTLTSVRGHTYNIVTLKPKDLVKLKPNSFTNENRTNASKAQIRIFTCKSDDLNKYKDVIFRILNTSYLGGMTMATVCAFDYDERLGPEFTHIAVINADLLELVDESSLTDKTILKIV